MNVLIYEIHSKLPALVGELQKIQNISIYFAFNDHEFKDLTNNINPNIIFVNHNVERLLMKYDLMNDLKMSIYIVDESLTKLNITKFLTHKKMSLKRIFGQKN